MISPDQRRRTPAAAWVWQKHSTASGPHGSGSIQTIKWITVGVSVHVHAQRQGQARRTIRGAISWRDRNSRWCWRRGRAVAAGKHPVHHVGGVTAPTRSRGIVVASGRGTGCTCASAAAGSASGHAPATAWPSTGALVKMSGPAWCSPPPLRRAPRRCRRARRPRRRPWLTANTDNVSRPHALHPWTAAPGHSTRRRNS